MKELARIVKSVLGFCFFPLFHRVSSLLMVPMTNDPYSDLCNTIYIYIH